MLESFLIVQIDFLKIYCQELSREKGNYNSIVLKHPKYLKKGVWFEYNTQFFIAHIWISFLLVIHEHVNCNW